MLDGTGFPSSVNLVFAICKDLFVGPQYTQSVLGTALASLPLPFQHFATFIQQLIKAQKVRDKAIPKVLGFCFLLLFRSHSPDFSTGPASSRSHYQV
jgi:hypothetical protein